MEGLVKTAWTNKQIMKASDAYKAFSKSEQPASRLSEEELDKLLKYLHKEKLDVGFSFITPTETGIYYPPASVERVKLLEQKGKIKDSGDKIVAQEHRGEKDGYVLSGNDRNVLFHELGHVIDEKQHTDSNHITSFLRKGFTGYHPETAAFSAGIGTLAGGLTIDESADDSLSPIEIGLLGGTAAALPTAALTATAGLLYNRAENAANRNGEQILRATNNIDDAQKLIPVFRENARLAKKTYTMNALRQLKNVPIAAAVGATGGTGLAALANKYIRENDGATQ